MKWTYESKVNVESKEMGDEKSTIKRYQGEQNVTSSTKKQQAQRFRASTLCFFFKTATKIGK